MQGENNFHELELATERIGRAQEDGLAAEVLIDLQLRSSVSGKSWFRKFFSVICSCCCTTMLFLTSFQLGGGRLKILMAVAMLWMSAVVAEESVLSIKRSLAFQCPPGFFSFGTSLSDTGNGAFAFPGKFASDNLPYGNTFFGRNAGRFSDGRLVVDFFDLAFGYPLLTAYLQSIAPDFSFGVNFAFPGATAMAEAPQVRFDLDFQVAQFSKFKQCTESAKQDPRIPSRHKLSLPEKSVFTKGLYILSFGRNDLTSAYTDDGFTPQYVMATVVPQIVQSVIGGIQTLYDNGARNFLVFNVPPQGCSPQYLTIFKSANKADYDEYGCLVPFNEVTQVLNSLLNRALEDLRSTLYNALILNFDYYQAFIALLDNPQSHGFAFDKTLSACCGVGGDYNYNAAVRCGTTAIIDNIRVSVESCGDPNEYISWDGIHYTDAFNRVIAELLLSGKFLEPPINMKTQCKLDLSKFTGANFTQAYPDGYLVGDHNRHVAKLNLDV